MTTFNITVQIDTKGAVRGARTVRRELEGIGSTADRVGRLIKGALAFTGVSLGIREFVNLADTFTNVQNRLKIVTDSTAELNGVTEELFRISKETRSSFESTAELYSRVALSSRELGISQRDTLDFTQSLNQAVILSGANAREASAGLIQLAQGLASGRLQGDELRSVLEQLPVVADVIANGLGVTRGELRKLGSEGKISAIQVIRAFQEAGDELEEKFGRTVPTIGQSFEILRTEAIRLFSVFNEGTGITGALSDAILFLAENLETVARIIAGGAAFYALTFAIRTVISAVSVLTAAIAANPLGALAVAIGFVISQLAAFSDQITVSSDGVTTLADLAGQAWDEASTFVSDAVTTIIDTVADLAGPLAEPFFEAAEDIDFSFQGIVTGAASLVETVISLFVGLTRAVIAAFQELPSEIGAVFIDTVNTLISATESAVNAIINGLNALPAAVSQIFEQTVRGAVEFFDALIEAANQIPDKLEQIFTVAWERVKQVTLAGVNVVIDALNVIPGIDIEPFFTQIGETISSTMESVGDSVDSAAERVQALSETGIPNIEFGRVANEFESEAGDLGTKVSEAFTSGLQFDAGVDEAVTGFFDRARERADKRIAEEQKRQSNVNNTRGTPRSPSTDDGKGPSFEKIRARLEAENELLGLNRKERELLADVLNIERKLKRSLTDAEEEEITALLQANQQLQMQADIVDDLRDPMQDVADTVAALNELYAQGRISANEYAMGLLEQTVAAEEARLANENLKGALFETGLQLIELRIQAGDGTMADGFIAQLGRMTQAAANFKSEAGGLLAEFTGNFASGVADAMANAIVYAEDLETALLSVAQNALQSLISGLIELGIQYVINQIIAQTVGQAATAAASAQAAALASAWATPAALASLASYGANAGPANAAIAGTIALTQGLAAASNAGAGFAEGGKIDGPGGPKEDKILARVSAGEFVVNAAATTKFEPLLEDINAGRLRSPDELVSNENPPVRTPVFQQIGAKDLTQDAERDPIFKRAVQDINVTGFAAGGVVVGDDSMATFARERRIVPEGDSSRIPPVVLKDTPNEPVGTDIFADLNRLGFGDIAQFDMGGQVAGAGGSRTDSVLARVSNGEFVVNKQATDQFLPLLEEINRGRFPAFADGGLVGPTSTPLLPTMVDPSAQRSGGSEASQGPAEVKNITVNAPITVNGAKDTASFERSKGQLARRLGMTIQRELDRNA
jgi:tape measure domain-containing protein